MYAIIGLQVVILAAIVTGQEINMALDSGAFVDLEISDARARTDPFRGASVSGTSLLDLDGRAAELPSARLRADDDVLVVFDTQPGRRPHIRAVQRGTHTAPRFSASEFTIPGKVLGDRDSRGGERLDSRAGGRLVARVGPDARVEIALDLPGSIPVDNAALTRLGAGPGLVRASLHRGFLGRRYFSDVRLVGRAWPPGVTLAYDDARERLVVLAPRPPVYRGTGERIAPVTDVFVFDPVGGERTAFEVAGRVIGAAVSGGDTQLIALVSPDAWGVGDVSLTRIGDDGQVLQRGVPVGAARIVGFDRATASAWVVSGSGSSQPGAPPYFVDRMTLTGMSGPRLGPFDSLPGAVASSDGEVWVVETQQHRVSRFELPTGRRVMESREVNGPTDVILDAGSAWIIEANRTQLVKLGGDGRVLWRVPQFERLMWIVPEPGTGGGWLGASKFEGRNAGLLRFSADGSISRDGLATLEIRPEWGRERIGVAALRSRDGRLYAPEPHAIAIVAPDGALLKRLDGYRFASEQRLRATSN
jgi:hypothetical protein